jgi:hypothetical protein
MEVVDDASLWVVTKPHKKLAPYAFATVEVNAVFFQTVKLLREVKQIIVYNMVEVQDALILVVFMLLKDHQIIAMHMDCSTIVTLTRIK